MRPAFMFRAIASGGLPDAGELFVVPDEHRRQVASLVLADGPGVLPQGAPPLRTIVLPVDPTLDDMLAAEIARALLSGETPPAGLRLFARYAAVVREGLAAGKVPLDHSLEGIYLAIRCDAGKSLVDPVGRRAFVEGWERLRERIWRAADEGLDPFGDLLDDGTHEFARETAMLSRDHEVFAQDVARGDRWLLSVPGWPPRSAGLLLRGPRSLLFKRWARSDRDAPLDQGTNLFLGVQSGPGQWVFSTDPVQRLSLEPLAARLQQAERDAAPARAAQDPWFDGAPFRHTLIASPKAGSALADAEVEAIVRAWLGATAAPPRTRVDTSRADTLPPPDPGVMPRRIGDFELVELLGKGGMGAVYKGRQQPLGRDVAVKIISRDYGASASAMDRFAREARLSACVNHPNVVTVHAAGIDAGRLFIAMELVRGGDADQLARAAGGRLPERRGLEILRDCARGLGALERAGLVHRDIKPANIFITEDGTAKLADLGLARSTSGDDRLTTTGLIVGTPVFMAPEQARGLTELDVRADIYSLGASLFSLLCGRTPFEGTDAITVLNDVIRRPPPDPRKLVPEMSIQTSKLILWCLAKDPGGRPRSASVLQTKVESLLDAL